MPLRATFNNPKFRAFPGKSPTDNLIQRGYMRLLSENLMIGDDEFKPKESDMVSAALRHKDLGTKLDFQFNPNLLTRAVTARTDTQLWINQSPSQLLQPGIGDMNFGWSMLFNREAEVSANAVSQHLKSATGIELGRSPFDDYLETLSIQSGGSGERGQAFDVFKGGTAEAAKVLGVLADIAILDRITGQSISLESYNYAKRRFALLKSQGLAYEEDELHITGDEEDITANEAMTLEEAADAAFGEGQGKNELLAANRFNSAFLVPNPVRAVFSEHFMVDGYVNQVTVTFQKFSPEMVPTVCMVDISMHAIYQGFARQKSAFTTFIQIQHELDKDPTSDDESRTVPVDPTDYVKNLLAAGAVNTEAARAPALFTGFDHNSDRGDEARRGFDFDSFELLDYSSGTVDEKQNAIITMPNGISFGVFSYMYDTYLGTVLSEQVSGIDHSDTPPHKKIAGNDGPNQIAAKVYLGMQVRARLKTQIDDSLSIADNDVNGRKAMHVLLEGSGENMGGWGQRHQNSEDNDNPNVFFATWSQGMRSDLLGVGYDNMPLPEATREAVRTGTGHPDGAGVGTASSGQFRNSGPYYTRSFPVLVAPNDESGEPRYGDQLYMKTIDVVAGHVEFNSSSHLIEGSSPPTWEMDGDVGGNPFAWIPVNSDMALKWGQDDDDDIEFQVAKGFWHSVGDSEPFAKTLTIYKNYPETDVKVFDIEYQFNLLYRVTLTWAVDDHIFSDTNWLVVKPRKEPVNYRTKGREQQKVQASVDNHTAMKEGSYEGTSDARLSVTPQGYGDPVHPDWIKAWDPDMPAGLIGFLENIHWDGYQLGDTLAGSTCFKWGVHGLFDKPGKTAAYFQKGHENGGKFKIPPSEEGA